MLSSALMLREKILVRALAIDPRNRTRIATGGATIRIGLVATILQVRAHWTIVLGADFRSRVHTGLARFRSCHYFLALSGAGGLD